MGQLSLIKHSQPHDVQHERAGRFDDTPGHYHNLHQEREGSYDDTEGHTHNAHQERAGSYADTPGHYHDLHQEREGSFADIDQIAIDSLVAGQGVSHTISLHQVRTLLQAAGCPTISIEIYVKVLKAGQLLVVGHVPDSVDVHIFDVSAPRL